MGAYVVGGMPEEEAPAMAALILRQYVELLQMPQMPALGLYRHITHSLALEIGYQIGVVVGGHLPQKAGLGIHPFHHIGDLLIADDGAIGGRKRLPCYLAYHADVVGSGLGYHKRGIIHFHLLYFSARVPAMCTAHGLP